MVAANLKIIQDLKEFLDNVCNYAVNRAFFTASPKYFSRKRDLPMALVIVMILDFFKRSLSIEIQEFFDSLCHKQVPTPSAFCQQRKKLDAGFFQMWNHVLCEGFYHHYGKEVKRWKGFLVLAADGSTVYFPPAKKLIEHFGTQTNQHGGKPMGRVMQLYDLLNGLTLWGELCPIRKSESTILSENLEVLPCNSVVVLDRYFPGMPLMYMLMHAGSMPHFVMRCKLGFNKEVKAFVCSHKPSKIIELHPTADTRSRMMKKGYIIDKDEVIRVRLVKFKISPKETEVLITDLLDEQLYTVEDLKALYALRWKIETNYGKQKNLMQMEQFSGLSVVCVQQDYQACLFASNLQSLVEKQCCDCVQRLSASRKYAYKINTNISLAAMKHWVVRLFIFEDPTEILAYLQAAFERNVVPVRPGRKFKRNKKAKRHKSKYQTFTNYKRAV
jgi:hypothetical protein